MTIKEALAQVVERRNLSQEDMRAVMREIMGGEATPAQIAGFLTALRMKGETVDEITAAVEVMRELATPVHVPRAQYERLVDIVGTGGDGAGLFNVSTASAFVVAAGGGRVAKHGGRAASSTTGSADLLEAAGATLELAPENVTRCIDEVGVGFMFAPLYHRAMRYAVGPRREMGVRTVFNVIGPLTNPALAPNELLGVFSAQWLEPVARVLRRLGSRHVMVVHSDDGLDEISIAAPTQVAELKAGEIRLHTLEPEAVGLSRGSLDSLRVSSAAESLRLIRAAFSGEPGPARDMIAFNAGAGLYVSGVAESVADGVRRALDVLDSGEAGKRLDRYAQLTQQVG